MANTRSAKKRFRQTIRRTERNKTRRSRMRSRLRLVEEAIESGNKAVAQQALQAAQPEMIRSAQMGLLHRNTAARKISRLSRRINTMSP